MNQLDWENIEFPLTLTNIKTQNGFYRLSSDSIIRIWRDDEFKLKGEIEGIISNEKELIYKGNPVKGSIIEGETILSEIRLDEKYKLLDCQIIPKTFKQIKDSNKKSFTAKLSLSRIIKYNDSDEKVHTIIDWHLSSKSTLIFPRMTVRTNDMPYKYRPDLAKDNTSDMYNEGLVVSLSRDFFILQFSDFVVIIQKIDKRFLPKWSDGIALEYNSAYSKLPDNEIRRGVSEYISFILGIKLFSVGNTILT